MESVRLDSYLGVYGFHNGGSNKSHRIFFIFFFSPKNSYILNCQHQCSMRCEVYHMSMQTRVLDLPLTNTLFMRSIPEKDHKEPAMV